MADHGIPCSMSRSGDVWDNAAMESFFSSLSADKRRDAKHDAKQGEGDKGDQKR
jgi:transposase InsO family protein